MATNSTPSCVPCTQSLLKTYAQWTNLTALNGVFSNAATITNQACGAGFIQLGVNAAAGHGVGSLMAVLSSLAVVTLLLSWGW